MKTSRNSLRNPLGNRKAVSGLALGLIVLMILASVVVIGVMHGDLRWSTSTSQVTSNLNCGSGTHAENGVCVPDTNNSNLQSPTSALYKMGVKNAMGSSLTSGAYVDVMSQNNLDSAIENITMTSAATAGTQALDKGSSYYFHVYAAPSGYYDAWFRVNSLAVGAAVERMTPVWHDGSLSWDIGYASIGPVGYQAGDTPYWLFPAFALYARGSTSQVGYAAQWSGATTVTATGASSTTLPSAGSQTSKYTASGTSFKIKFQVSTTATSVTIGEPMLVLTSSMPRTFRALFMVLWFAMNDTRAVDTDGPFVNGFHRIAFASTVWSVYWKVIAPVESTQISTGSRDEEISLDTAPITAATVIALKFYCTDLQSPADVAQGSYDPVATQYGAESDIGLSTTIDANGFTYSSAVPTSECCYTVITTA